MPAQGERDGLLASPPAQPGRVFDTSPHPRAAGAGSGRGTNTAVTGHMAEALGNSGENRDPAAAGGWKGDSPGENSRTPCDHERDRFPSLGPYSAFIHGGTLSPRYAPLEHKPQGPHPPVSAQAGRYTHTHALSTVHRTRTHQAGYSGPRPGNTRTPALGRKQTAHARLTGTGPGTVLTESRTCTHRPPAPPRRTLTLASPHCPFLLCFAAAHPTPPEGAHHSFPPPASLLPSVRYRSPRPLSPPSPTTRQPSGRSVQWSTD